MIFGGNTAGRQNRKGVKHIHKKLTLKKRITKQIKNIFLIYPTARLIIFALYFFFFQAKITSNAKPLSSKKPKKVLF